VGTWGAGAPWGRGGAPAARCRGCAASRSGGGPGLDPEETETAFALVTEVDREQHGGEGLEADRVRERPAVEPAHVRDARDEIEDGLAGSVVVGADDHVAVDRVIEGAEDRGRGEGRFGGRAGAGGGRLHRP